MKKVLFAVLLSVLFFPGASRAEEQTARIESVVVEAARTEADSRQIPAAVDIVTSEELAVKAKSGDFYDALKNLPGVHTDKGSGMGWPTIKVRGETPTVLLNGVNINPYITFSPFSILSADMDAVERIELLKGAQAAIQGSGAMSGAVNVIMKKGDADHPYMKIRMEGGSGDAMGGSFTLSGGQDTIGWFVNYAQNKSGDIDTPLGTIPYTDSEYRNLYARIDYQLKDTQAISLETIHSDGEYRTGGQGYYYITDANSKIWQNEPDTTGFFLKYKGDFDRLRVNATAGYMGNTLDYVYGDAPSDFISFEQGKYKAYMDETYYLADLNALVKVLENDLLNLHVNYTHKTTDAEVVATGTYGFNYDSTQHLNSLVGQLESRPVPHVLLLAGIRHDMYDTDGKSESKTSPNAGISIFPFASTAFNWTTLWASYSESFKMPPSNYLNLPAVMGGNPDLNPEESESWELGIKQQVKDWASFSISYFNTDYQDQIVFDLSEFQMGNIGRSSAKGYEFQLEVYLNDQVTLYTNFMDMERTDEATGERTYSSPNPDSKLVLGALIKDFHGFCLSVEGAYYLDFKLEDDYGAHPVEDKVVLDTRISYDLFDNGTMKVAPYIKVNNITDETLYCAGDTPGLQAGRTFYGGITATCYF